MEYLLFSSRTRPLPRGLWEARSSLREGSRGYPFGPRGRVSRYPATRIGEELEVRGPGRVFSPPRSPFNFLVSRDPNRVQHPWSSRFVGLLNLLVDRLSTVLSSELLRNHLSCMSRGFVRRPNRTVNLPGPLIGRQRGHQGISDETKGVH